MIYTVVATWIPKRHVWSDFGCLGCGRGLGCVHNQILYSIASTGSSFYRFCLFVVQELFAGALGTFCKDILSLTIAERNNDICPLQADCLITSRWVEMT